MNDFDVLKLYFSQVYSAWKLAVRLYSFDIDK
jgi:hypothetical protein